MEHYTNTPKAALKPLKLRNLFNQYLAVKKSNRTLFDIFLWWERKRTAFNIVVLALCYLSFEVQRLLTHSSAELFTKRELIIFIVLYNIVYSTFCVLEFFVKKNRKYGPIMFKNALFICSAIITIPTVFHIVERIVF